MGLQGLGFRVWSLGLAIEVFGALVRLLLKGGVSGSFFFFFCGVLGLRALFWNGLRGILGMIVVTS